MVVDYSKWDKLEVSDDSDIEVHPNVDKKSFIRWKQRDIHEKREQRRHEIASLQAENVMNANLLARLDKLLGSLRGINDDTAARAAVERACAETDEDRAAEQSTSGPTYAVMMKSLADQVVHDAAAAADKPFVAALVDSFKTHYEKLSQLQLACQTKLTELQNEEAKHITSDDLHIGFDSTRVAKPVHADPAPSKAKNTKNTKAVEQIEVINKPAAAPDPVDDVDDGAVADDEGDDDYKASPLAQEFAKIPIGQYQKCLEFIGKHPGIVSEDEADGILFDAFGEEMAGREKAAKRHVHNALLLQYCARLGGDGVTVFFRKIMTPKHPALDAFMQDVESTYKHIKQRSKVLLEEQAKNGEVEEEIVDLEELDDDQLAEFGLTKADVERLKREQAEKESA